MQLAQVNIALPVAPLSTPELAGFVAELEPLNALADGAPGFVWRMQTEDGDATAVRGFGDDRLIVNMSVWTSVEALAGYVYSGHHREVMARRRQWFSRMREAFQVLWWVPDGTRPTVADAEERLDHLRRNGPTPRAFTFRSPFPAPDAVPGAPAPRVDGDAFCRA
ncbi:DUF3291 domain-containing protein [Pseudonocardia lacus]|uniref:DUF3291 domain-containing protein n=1 Tax=Pseudonocardia lacus TaxID=2835865 RepID=UPI001BDCD0C3|nr:DUF3291 domain-containing protein [Pseudonocardia lacus]